jgi:hypothetical protein
MTTEERVKKLFGPADEVRLIYASTLNHMVAEIKQLRRIAGWPADAPLNLRGVRWVDPDDTSREVVYH